MVGHHRARPTRTTPTRRRLAVRHLLEPVRFRELTRPLHDDGVRAFVQVGTGSLAGFVDDTLHGQDHLAVAAADTATAGRPRCAALAAALWAEGLSPRWDRLAGPAAGPAPVTGPAASGP